MGERVPTRVSDITDVVDYVANGSFASLKENVSYSYRPDYAVLVRLVDYKRGWTGEHVYVNRHAYEFLRKSSLNPGDVVISNVGANAGTVFRVPDLGQPMTLGPNAITCRPSAVGRLDSDFLFYYFGSSKGQEALSSIKGGSAQPKFNKTDFRALLIPLPPLSEQRAIANFLGTLDDKIELNRRMNETLEAIARAIYQVVVRGLRPRPRQG